MMERLFLLRKSNNRIEGPFNKRDVLDQLESGQLAPNDEIAPAGAYWFHVHEAKEIENWVGAFERDKTVIDADDLTLTMNRNVADLGLNREASRELNREPPQRSPLAPDPDGEEDEVTDPMLNAANAAAQAAARARLMEKGPPRGPETFRIESTSYWKWLAVILIPIILLVVYRILGLAQFLP